jgi:hypothetical protein
MLEVILRNNTTLINLHMCARDTKWVPLHVGRKSGKTAVEPNAGRTDEFCRSGPAMTLFTVGSSLGLACAGKADALHRH